MTITNIGEAILLTSALVQVLKDATKLNTRYAPLASVLIGLGIVALYVHPFTSDVAIVGLTVGLSACGLYSGVSTTVNSSSNTPNTVVGSTVVSTDEKTTTVSQPQV